MVAQCQSLQSAQYLMIRGFIRKPGMKLTICQLHPYPMSSILFFSLSSYSSIFFGYESSYRPTDIVDWSGWHHHCKHQSGMSLGVFKAAILGVVRVIWVLWRVMENEMLSDYLSFPPVQASFPQKEFLLKTILFSSMKMSFSIKQERHCNLHFSCGLSITHLTKTKQHYSPVPAHEHNKL
jgi:hypothetical protein